MTDSPGAEKTRLPHFRELDGLRGFAVVVVFIHHFVQRAQDPPPQGWPPLILHLRQLASFGRLGVDIFFVLSGFLITSLLLIDRGKTHFFHNFYWKRALRILPVYFIYLGTMAIVHPPSRGYVLVALLFMANFGSRFHISYEGVAWTLSIEEQFYLIWPHFVRRFRVSQLYYTAFALSLISMTLRLVVPMWRGSIDNIYTFYRCDGLALGAILALQWFTTGGRTPFIDRALSILNSRVTLLVVIFGELTVLMFFHGSIVDGCLTIATANYLTYRLVRRIIFHGAPWGVAWLGKPVPVYLGAISYSMYLFQGMVFEITEVRSHMTDFTHYGSAVFRLALSLLLTILVCTASRYLVELPVQDLRRLVLKPSLPDPAARFPAGSDRMNPVVK